MADLLQLKLSMHGLQEVSQTLERLLKHLEQDSFAKPLTAWGEAAHSEVQRKFDTYGPGWKRPARSTRIQRLHRKDKGQLSASLTTKHAKFSIWELKWRELTIGSTHPGAITFQFGATIHRPALRKSRSEGPLRWWSKGGDVVFRQSAGPVTITIPRRPVYEMRDLSFIAYSIFNKYLEDHLP